MSFKKYAVSAFKNEKRRLISLAIAQLLLWSSMYVMIYYVDQVCAHPVAGFISIFTWICLMIGLVWVSLMAVSPHVILPSLLTDYFYSAWEKENYSLLIEVPLIDPFDPRRVQVNPQSRFRFLFFTSCFVALIFTHFTHQSFFIRYQKSGYLITYLRNTNSDMRLKGLNLMIDLGKRTLLSDEESHLPKNLEKVLLSHLNDAHEGVRARAAFVIGRFDIISAVPLLAKMAQKDEILREVALFALGEVKVQIPLDNPAQSALLKLSKNPKIQESSTYALSIALGTQKLITHDLLWQFYQTHRDPAVQSQSNIDTQAKDNQKIKSSKVGSVDTLDEKKLESLRIRQASIWALGESRDAVLVDRLGYALKDPNLSIRCLAAYGLEKVVAFESSPHLRTAFEASHKDEYCVQLETPVQVGGKGHIMLPKRSYQLTLARALATTDDPILLTWMVTHQEGIEIMAHRLLYKYYKALEQKDKSGLLEGFKRRNKQ
jgi:hypothetical protein